MNENYSGVEENVPAAGGQEDFSMEEYLDSYQEADTGVKEETPAAEEGYTEEPVQDADGDSDDSFGDERVEKAFAKRLDSALKKKEEELRREMDEKLKSYSSKTREEDYSYQQEAPQQSQGGVKDLTRMNSDQLQEQADEWMMSYEAILHMQQQQKRNAYMERAVFQTYDERERNAARTAAEKSRKTNQYLPEWNDEAVNEIRANHYRETKQVLPYKAAWRLYVGEQAEKGSYIKNVSRATEQKTLKNVAKRNRANVQAGGGQQAGKPSLDDLPDEDFEAMIAKAKAGAYKRS